MVGTSSFGMSGVNAHALLASCPVIDSHHSAQQLMWQQRRHAILPAPHILLESVSWLPVAQVATFACRMQSAHLNSLWSHGSLPSAVPLELGLAAVAVLSGRPSASSLQAVVLSGAGQLQPAQQACPVIVASMGAASGQISIASRFAGGLDTLMSASAAATAQPAAPAFPSTKRAAWLLPTQQTADLSTPGCTASLATSNSSGFCTFPAAQQAALDLVTASGRAGGCQLSAVSCITTMSGHTPQHAAAACSTLSVHAAAMTTAHMAGMSMHPAGTERPAPSAADGLAYAVQLQVADAASAVHSRPSHGKAFLHLDSGL